MPGENPRGLELGPYRIHQKRLHYPLTGPVDLRAELRDEFGREQDVPDRADQFPRSREILKKWRFESFQALPRDRKIGFPAYPSPESSFGLPHDGGQGPVSSVILQQRKIPRRVAVLAQSDSPCRRDGESRDDRWSRGVDIISGDEVTHARASPVTRADVVTEWTGTTGMGCRRARVDDGAASYLEGCTSGRSIAGAEEAKAEPDVPAISPLSSSPSFACGGAGEEKVGRDEEWEKELGGMERRGVGRPRFDSNADERVLINSAAIVPPLSSRCLRVSAAFGPTTYRPHGPWEKNSLGTGQSVPDGAPRSLGILWRRVAGPPAACPFRTDKPKDTDLGCASMDPLCRVTFERFAVDLELGEGDVSRNEDNVIDGNEDEEDIGEQER
ncbi:hypothetical protein WN55_09201 [Dufourea novaeangliae]|uniref:Uncharacterized protein n=1 Tax=Dufourea novaeangliae TaxID=178035 RepID=A0A154P8W3_DUFNO|nr:hypothetical protein WN55_09201 [Dufourea novaeangliae]